MDAPEPGPPSAFFVRHREALAESAALGPAADVACGRGRHALALGRAGASVVALDRSGSALAGLAAAALRERLPVHPVRADLEAAPHVPLRPARCGAVIVTRYLHRPLCPALAAVLAPGGLLLYETFTRAQAELPYGPENPAFLLRRGELPGLFPTLEVLEHEEGLFEDGRRWALARLLARRPA